jgi:putative endonuclease
VTAAHAAAIPNKARDLDAVAECSDLSFRAYKEISLSEERTYFVYLLTNKNNRVMYVGVTNDLKRRVYEHKTKAVKGFTKKYNVNKLVYSEQTNDVLTALAREKEIKKWRREKKNALVIQLNPRWNDLINAI